MFETLSPFDTPFKVSIIGDYVAKFGVDFPDPQTGKSYYQSNYGLAGHNGADLLPTGDNKMIFNMFKGLVTWAGLNPDKPSYGNRIVIWNQELNIIDTYNHLEYIHPSITRGMILGTKGNILGKMGHTGVGFGDHLHYQIGLVDVRGGLLNQDRNDLECIHGYIDPIQYLTDHGLI